MLDSEIGKINIEDIANSSYSFFALDSEGYLRYNGRVVAILAGDKDFYSPSILLETSSLDSQGDDQKAITNLNSFLAHELALKLTPIFNLKTADKLSVKAQEIADLLLQNYGVVKRSLVTQKLQELDQFDRATLRQLGVRFGRFHVYMPNILKPGCIKILMMLFALQNNNIHKNMGEAVVEQMLRGKTTMEQNDNIEDIYYRLAGYDLWNNYAIRVDITERLANYVQHALNWRTGIEPKAEGAYNGCYFFITPHILSILGVGYDVAAKIFRALGYVSNNTLYDAELAKDAVQIKPLNDDDPVTMDLWTFVNNKAKLLKQHKIRDKTKVKVKAKPVTINYDSPFSVLLKLKKEL